VRLPGRWTPVLLLVSVLGGRMLAAEKEENADREGLRDASAAIFTLKVHIDLEKARLDRSLGEYQAAEGRRAELQDRISSLYDRLGAALRKGSTSPDEESEESLAMQIESAERAEELTRQEMRRLREQIADSRERIRFIQERLSTLHRSPTEEPEGLSGSWDVVYMPSKDKAVFTLRQSGVIIEGEYQQDGGYRGSLQGTLINNKLVLHRIDSKLGAISDLEGQLSSDLKTVKGSWMSRVIADDSPVTGAWTAAKREPRKKSDGSAP